MQDFINPVEFIEKIGDGGVLPPIADFSGDPLSGDAPLTVQFTDLSTNNPTSWAWDFGDESEGSTQQNPEHEYAQAGTYTVSLTATNAGGSDVETKSNYVTAAVPIVFPEVVSSANSSQNSDVTSHPINIPSGSGGRLILFFANDGNATVSGLSSWNLLQESTDNAGWRGRVYERSSTGSDSLTITTSAAEASAAICFRVSGAGAPQSAKLFQSTSTTDRPLPSLTPSGGSKKYLWLVATMPGNANDATVPTKPSADYANTIDVIGGTTSGGARVSASHRKLESASLSPPPFTTPYSTASYGYTVAVPPA